MNRLLIAIIALGIVAGTSSCNLWRRVTGQRKAVSGRDTATVVSRDSTFSASDATVAVQDTALVAPDPLAEAQRLAMIRQWLPLWNSATRYSTFSGKAKVNYEGKGESHELNASIRMERDKRIWISITALLGIEVARAFITPDTIIAINRLNKEVRVVPFAEADKLFPVHVDFATLQRLIIGDVLHTGTSLTQVVDKDSVLSLIAMAPDYFQLVSYIRTDTTLKAQVLETRGASLQAMHNNYNLTGNRRFSNSRELNMTDSGEAHRITLEFTKVSFDGPVDMSFSVPSKYERK